MNELQIKPCPFCGGEASLNTYQYFTDNQKSYVECKKCEVEGKKFQQDPWDEDEEEKEEDEHYFDYCESQDDEFEEVEDKGYGLDYEKSKIKAIKFWNTRV